VVTNEVVVTDAATGAVVTNCVPVFCTNLVQVPVTNLVAKPEALATLGAANSVVNTFAPGIGSIVALVLGGLYRGYRQLRNRKVNEALVQGIETPRAVLTTTPQGQAMDAQFVKWLMQHQKGLNFGCKLLGPAHLRPRPKEFDIRTVRRIILVRCVRSVIKKQ
jgi:hypothetical protein